MFRKIQHKCCKIGTKPFKVSGVPTSSSFFLAISPPILKGLVPILNDLGWIFHNTTTFSLFWWILEELWLCQQDVSDIWWLWTDWTTQLSAGNNWLLNYIQVWQELLWEAFKLTKLDENILFGSYNMKKWPPAVQCNVPRKYPSLSFWYKSLQWMLSVCV